MSYKGGYILGYQGSSKRGIEIKRYINRCAKGKRFVAKLTKISDEESYNAQLLEEELYDKAQGKFEGVEGYGTEEEWSSGDSSDWTWVYWYCVDVVEDYIKQKEVTS